MLKGLTKYFTAAECAEDFEIEEDFLSECDDDIINNPMKPIQLPSFLIKPRNYEFLAANPNPTPKLKFSNRNITISKKNTGTYGLNFMEWMFSIHIKTPMETPNGK